MRLDHAFAQQVARRLLALGRGIARILRQRHQALAHLGRRRNSEVFMVRALFLSEKQGKADTS